MSLLTKWGSCKVCFLLAKLKIKGYIFNFTAMQHLPDLLHVFLKVMIKNNIVKYLMEIIKALISGVTRAIELVGPLLRTCQVLATPTN